MGLICKFTLQPLCGYDVKHPEKNHTNTILRLTHLACTKRDLRRRRRLSVFTCAHQRMEEKEEEDSHKGSLSSS
jgi:hypothetical protein